ncbi:hypothetical protein ACG01O_15870 [Roseateles sp. BYS87W]|uniref:General secretion pathway protein GspN n=1 Tax=Pelomonas baiyunensis TaxID=3299026 RepID=A0ABW7H2G9_9BURK
MSVTPRQYVLAGALGLTVAATVWLATQPDDEAPVAAARPLRAADRVGARAALAASAPSTAAATGAAASAPARPAWAEVSDAQLAAWQPPPPPPAQAVPAQASVQPPPPPPVAPPAPYQMIGRLIEGEGARAVQVALLSGPNKALSVKAGDVLDGQWRVEQVSDAGVRLTWLPGPLPQTIVFKAVP